jgi:hypothetical protein
LRALSIVAVSILAMSCTPYVKECEIPVLEATEGLAVRIPVEYGFRCNEGVVRIAAGERWYPTLSLDAIETNGAALRLEDRGCP